jgi:hypothetical protein
LVALIAPAAILVGNNVGFLLALVLGILTMGASGGFALYRRGALGLNAAQIAGTAVLAVICLPSAGNFARALALKRVYDIVLPDLAQASFKGPRLCAAIDEFRLELESERRLVEEGTAEAARLDAAIGGLPGALM